MRRAIAVLLLTTVLGCGPSRKDKEPPAKGLDPAPVDPVKKAEGPKKPPSGTITRRFEVGELQNLLRNLSIAHQAFEGDRGRSPNRREELESYYEKNAKINQLIEGGDIIVLWKSIRPEEPSKTVLAYEAAIDGSGNRLVLFFDGMSALVPDAEFAKMPKAQQRK